MSRVRTSVRAVIVAFVAVFIGLFAAASPSGAAIIPPPSGTVGVAYTYTFSADPLSPGCVLGGLPPGLTYDSATLTISGTPTVDGTFQVTNLCGNDSTAVVTITIDPAAETALISPAVALALLASGFGFFFVARRRRRAVAPTA